MSDAALTAAQDRRAANRTALLLGGVLLLVALNLRLAVTSVGPVLEEIRADTGLSHVAAGLLTSTPVLCFGAFAPLAPTLARRFGGDAVLLGCLALVATGIGLRLLPGAAPLFAGTIVAGAAIAVANVVLPSIIKRDFRRPGPMMGVYSMGLGVSGTLSAAATVPLAHATGSWRWALALWGVPALVAGLLWLPEVRRAHADDRKAGIPPRVRLWRSRLAWQVTALMGTQSVMFYVLASWVPTLFREEGMSASHAGLLLSLALLCGLPTSLVVPAIAGRLRDQRAIGVVIGLLWMAGWVGLAIAPAAAPVLWMVVIGMAQGAGVALALMLFVLRSPDGAHTAALSGMAQTVGYLSAAPGPVLVGALHDATGGWRLPLGLMAVVALCFIVASLTAGRAGGQVRGVEV